MAKAGSGDVLTGLIAGLIALGLQEDEAGSLGVWLHGLAGRQSGKEKRRSFYSGQGDCRFNYAGGRQWKNHLAGFMRKSTLIIS